MTCMETPVAPIGCPLAFSPPDGLTGSRPFFSAMTLVDHLPAFAGLGQPHGLVLDHLGDGEAVMGLDQIEVVQRHAGTLPRFRPGPAGALESGGVAARQRQDIVDLWRARKPIARGASRRFPHRRSRGGGPVRHQRAVGTPERPRHQRVLVRQCVAEIEAQILPHLGIGIFDAVAVVLGRDPGQFRAPVAVALEVVLGDPPEDAGEAAFDLGLLVAVARRQQDIGDGGDRKRLIFSAPTTSAMRPRPHSTKSSAAWIAADPVAQAFSTWTDGV